MPNRRLTFVFQRLALIAFGLIFGLLVTEAALQLGAYAYRQWTGTRLEFAGPRISGRTRIACIGDSNTFGIWTDPQQTYPAQVRTLLTEAVGPDRFEIFNLGVPGAPSGSFGQRLNELLDTFEPDVVIAMVGVNNLLRDPEEPVEAGQPMYARFVRALKQASRLYQVYRFVVRGWQASTLALQPEFETHDAVGTAILHLDDHAIAIGSHLQQKNFAERRRSKMQLIEDLDWMNAVCQARGVRFVVMTYLSKEQLYGEINETIRAAVEERHLTLIDNAITLTNPTPDMFLPDQHPTAAGYAVVARNVADFLLRKSPQ
ncbi:MAG: SGNH/GDSL hydrolase family protein [Deltaproteobacteria bacterium]|nr:SGNH/GDSL hydrolase family protein [Deltaproteobacteria bacterium]MBI3386768.1 SGNH/GDSL hydrolase family protein [Deltaproteobacteria bacterium]